MAKGEIPPPAEEAGAIPDMATIDAAFMDADLHELRATADAVTRCNGDLAAIDAVLMEKIDSAQAPDLGALASLLKEAQSVLDDQLARRGVGDNAAAGVAEAAQTGTPAAQPHAISGEIRTREDAVRMMDKISDYFQHNEPSSPIPLLMQRAKRLVSKNFIDILRDLAPDGVSQAENVGGVGEER
jgi:type VI secretion system protein ImpA